MAVCRIEKTRDYTVMSNHHLKDRTLTLKSKGLLSMMLSLPDEWNYTTRGLAAICREGVDSIGAALKELENHGYIRRTQLRDEKGKITDTEYVIYEMPQCEPSSSPGTPLPGTAKPYTEKPDMGIPDTAEPCTENPVQLNTNQTKTDLLYLQGEAGKLRPFPCAGLHHGRRNAFPVCGLYGNAGEPGRFVPRLRLCRQVHQTTHHL